LRGEARSCFSMTEPHTSGADPTGLTTRAVRDGDHYVLNGRKWFTTGAVGARFAIVMAVTDPEAPPHARSSQIIVPAGTAGFNVLRSISVMGHSGGSGHCEVVYEDCRVPVTNRLGPEGSGFPIAQARLGPGRIHHCMRAIGAAERAIEMMCRRANERHAFGGPLADKQFVQDFIARSRLEVDQARLLTFYAAWKMDTHGKREARQEIAMIKVAAANVYMKVLDRAIQVFGAMGVSDDTPLARMWRYGRILRIGDGPDEVHKMVIARRELKRFG
ncbi:MAG: acyl-CoA dehydrogenase family protein, partial [Deltaproteobacteria bacterium]|nr:acyl-CoA dehydrogenase family protein [Deltaproteobacteria bacterium]